MIQQAKPLHVGLASHVSFQFEAQLFLFCSGSLLLWLGKTAAFELNPWAPSLTRETQELQAPGFGLVQLWPLQPFWNWNSGWNISFSVSIPFSYFKSKSIRNLLKTCLSIYLKSKRAHERDSFKWLQQQGLRQLDGRFPKQVTFQPLEASSASSSSVR